MRHLTFAFLVVLLVAACDNSTSTDTEEIIEGKGYVVVNADTYMDDEFPEGEFIVMHFIDVEQGQDFLDEYNCTLLNIDRTNFTTADADTFCATASRDSNGYFYLTSFSSEC